MMATRREARPETGPVLPSDPDAEESLLGAMLLHDSAIAAAAELTPSDFYRVQNATVFDAIRRVHADRRRADVITTADHLRTQGLLETIGGTERLLELQLGTSGTSAAPAWVEILARLARHRRLAIALDRAADTLRHTGDVDLAQLERTVLGDHAREGDDSWAALDLAPLLADLDFRADRIGLQRVDGVRLVQAGVLTLFIGEPESGKSWAAIFSAVSEIRSGAPVMWIDLEQGPRKVIRDLMLAGLNGDEIARGLRYVPVDRRPDPGEMRRIAAAHVEAGGVLVVIDSIGELVERMGFDPMKQARSALNLVVDPLLGEGLTVVGIDHVVKDESARGNYAHGDQGKSAKSTVIVSFDKVRDEPMGKGRRGRTHLSIGKDRWGDLGEHIEVVGRARRFGDLVLDSTGPELLAEVLMPTSGEHDTSAPKGEAKRRQERSLLRQADIAALLDAGKANDDIITLARAGMVLGINTPNTVKHRMEVLEEMRLVTREEGQANGGRPPVVWRLTLHGKAMRK
jgi:hypothetical protein